MQKTVVFLVAALACANGSFAESDPFERVRSGLKAGQRVIKIPKGVYEVAPKLGSRSYLRLDGVKNVTVDFSGSELRGLAHARVFHLENCEDVTIRNLVVDYKRLPFTQGRITAVDGEKSWQVKILAGYESPVENLSWIRWGQTPS